MLDFLYRLLTQPGVYFLYMAGGNFSYNAKVTEVVHDEPMLIVYMGDSGEASLTIDHNTTVELVHRNDCEFCFRIHSDNIGPIGYIYKKEESQ